MKKCYEKNNNKENDKNKRETDKEKKDTIGKSNRKGI
jgi:hypothetical protein